MKFTHEEFDKMVEEALQQKPQPKANPRDVLNGLMDRIRSKKVKQPK